jgi:hypothetical protein
VEAVATDGAVAVWVESNAVRSCPVTGCSATIPPTTLNGSPVSSAGFDSVTIDGGSAYWLSDSLVQRCPLTGCSGDNETFATAPLDPYGRWRRVAVHSGVVYMQTSTTLYQCLVGGCASPSPIFGRLDNFDAPFAVDDTGVYITVTGEEYGTYYCAFGNCPPALGSPIATPGGSHLAAVNGVVYMWDPYGQGDITSCANGGCPNGPTVVAPGQTMLTSLAADASGVYWTTSDGTTGSVFSCALPDCASGPRTLAANQANPTSVALSDHYVVWANQRDAGTPGSIMGLAK